MVQGHYWQPLVSNPFIIKPLSPNHNFSQATDTQRNKTELTTTNSSKNKDKTSPEPLSINLQHYFIPHSFTFKRAVTKVAPSPYKTRLIP